MVFNKSKHVDLTELMHGATEIPARKELAKGEGYRALVVSLPGGQRIEPHEEPNGVLFVVLAGEGTITAGDERYYVGPGHAVLVEVGQVRGIEAINRLTVIGIQQTA